MTYTQNPSLPKVRQQAVELVRKGWSARKVGRYLGFHHTAVMKWVQKAKVYGNHPIPTKSSRPKHHPKELSQDIVWKIFHKRLETKRCAEVVYQELRNEGVSVSLSSVKRVLDRTGLLKKRSPWKRYHAPTSRPEVKKPGDLVQIDTIHLTTGEKKKIYVFTLLDVYSRWAYAKAYPRATCTTSLSFVREAQKYAPFQFTMLQSDHGSEFSSHFTERIKISHRHSRVRRPNDNAHLERFNRTLQEECLDHIQKNVPTLNKALKLYIPHYNYKRLHLGINLKTPSQLVPSY